MVAGCALIVVVIAAEEEVEAYFLIGPHIICPRAGLGFAVGVEAETEQFVVLHFGGGDDVDYAVL